MRMFYNSFLRALGLIFFSLMLWGQASAQAVVYSENFDAPTNCDAAGNPWTASGSGAGRTDDESQSGLCSIFAGTSANSTNTSPVIDLSAYTNVNVSAWIWEEAPEVDDRVDLQYQTSGGSWVTFEVLTRLSGQTNNFSASSIDEALPADAIHANSRFRLFVVSADSGGANDQWYIDDFTLTGTIALGAQANPPPGSGSGSASDPFTSLAEAYSVSSSGDYYFNLGSGNFIGSVDTSEGGGWVLVAQYVHQGNTSPDLNVIGAGSDLPSLSFSTLGANESNETDRWGHAGNAAASQFTGDIEFRWYGETSNHGRIIHFRSSIGDSYFRNGTGNFDGIDNNFTPLTSHTANLPGQATNHYVDKTDYALTNFPFWLGGNYHWAVRGERPSSGTGANGSAWEVDDISATGAADTIHRVWVRNVDTNYTVTTNADSGAGSLRAAIDAANASTTLDNITFDISGTGVKVINIASNLPALTDDGITIDGRTQGDTTCGDPWNGTPSVLRVRLDGGDTVGTGLTLQGDDQKVIGLAIGNFTIGALIDATAVRAELQCNYIGLLPSGSPASNTTGVSIKGADTIIGGLGAGEGNVVSRNTWGILTTGGSTNTAIRGNFIGTEPTGTSAQGNTSGGIGNGVGASTLSEIRGNLISGNDRGLYFQVDDEWSGVGGSPLVFAGNYVGTDRTGLTALPNTNEGLLLSRLVLNDFVIGGTNASDRNVISGNGGSGIEVNDQDGVDILGNYIGIDANGIAALPNGSNGLLIDNATNITVGGTAAGARNVISGNNSDGIYVTAGNTISVLGNYIGVGADGSTDLGNNQRGIEIDNSTDVFVGDGTAAGRNIISGNENRPVRLRNGSTNVSIDGNYIGTDASGNAVVPGGSNTANSSAYDGVVIATGTYNNIIINDNVIAGLTGQGIETSLSTTINGMTIQGNLIGEFANGNPSATFNRGIFMSASNINDLLIGGPNVGDGNSIANATVHGIDFGTVNASGLIQGNTIYGHADKGILLQSTNTLDLAIIENAIYNNGGLGIDLAGGSETNGVTANDAGDGDLGPNDRLNYPVINQISAGGSTSVGYSIELDVPANTQGYRIEFFKNTSPDSPNGEGEIFLGFVDTGDHAGGAISYDGSFTSAVTVSVGDSISATTTRKTGATAYDITSEFAANVLAVSPLVVTNTNDSGTGSLRAAIEYANANASEDNITFDIPGNASDAHTITLTSALPSITDTGISVDGTTQGDASCGILVNGTPHDLRIKLKGFGGDIENALSFASGSNQSVRGLSIGGFGGSAVKGEALVSNILVECNYISVDPDGITPDPNSTGATIEDDILMSNVDNITIRNNLFAGNNTQGADAIQIGGDGGRIEGNLFGTDETGNAPLPYRHISVVLVNSTNTIVGGTNAGEGNIFGGSQFGIRVTGNSANNVSILGNQFGVGSDGSSNIGGDIGVQSDTNASNVLIGDGSSAGANLFRNQTNEAIRVINTGSAAILANSIANNGALGIDLDDNGITDNDLGDIDTGPNDFLNFPVIDQISADGTTTVGYSVELDVPANTEGYRIEFFKNTSPDATNGEGEIFLGFVDTGDHAGGAISYDGSFTASEAVSVGDSISATTTRKTGATAYDITSEFAANVLAVSPLVVTNTNDSGAGSLRAAIDFANANAAEDNITFAIDGAGPHVITPLTALPGISDDGVSIDGTTQTGATCGDLWSGTPHTLLINLDGNGLSTYGLTTTVSGVSITGLAIGGFNGGLVAYPSASNTQFKCNYVGLNPDGTANGNATTGIIAHGTNTLIGGPNATDGNVISSNGSVGISVGPNVVNFSTVGNFIGTDPTGLLDRGNGGVGLNQYFGGTATWGEIRNNLISGNGNDGIELSDSTVISGSSGDVIFAGNYIGADRTGNTALPNGAHGIEFPTGSISGVTIGGTNAADRNIISGNTADGINLGGVSNITMLGNYVGLGEDGSTDVGNGGSGIETSASTGITIGNGTSAGRNIVSSNNSIGIDIRSNSSATISDNYIGVASDGTTARGNRSASIAVQSSSTAVITKNIIAYSETNDGIELQGGTPMAAIYENAIFGNSEQGIELDDGGVAGEGVNANDVGDSDTGPNDLLNFPVINTITASGTTSVGYSVELDVPANTEGYRIEFYKNTSPDTTNGEGEIFLGFVDTGDHTGGAISYDGSFTSAVTISVGESISATTTRKTGATAYDITSEFAANVLAVSPLVVTNTNDSGAGSLRDAITYANANSAADNITFAIPNAGPHRINLSSALPQFTDDGISIDGTTQAGASCGTLNAGIPHTLQIMLDGQGGGIGFFSTAASNITLKGLAVGNSAGKGFLFTGGSGHAVECNYWGVETDGVTASPLVQNNSTSGATQSNVSATIHNNLFSGNNDDGGDVGFTVGGGSGLIFTGNVVGLTADGSATLGNSNFGMNVSGATNLTIGGATASDRNIFAGNGTSGLYINSTATGLTIQGNYFGVGPDGKSVRANGQHGLFLNDTVDATIGGNGVGEGNIFGNAVEHGIYGFNATNISILGNKVGLSADETTPIGNGGHGILLSGGSSGIVGGISSEEGNIITHSFADGIRLTDANIAILGNAIYSNGQQGIDDTGVANSFPSVTANDSPDTDGILNYPVINQISAGGTTTVGYSVELDVPANTEGYRIEFFKNTSPDSTNGEGEIFLGFVDTGDHAGGAISYDGSFTSAVTVTVGDSISATATRKTGATAYDITSEFAANVLAASPLVVTNTNDSGTGSLRAAITHANANAAEDTITFAIPGTGPHKISLTSILPIISDANVTIDGTTQSGASCGDLWGGTPHTLMIETNFSAYTGDGLRFTGDDGAVKGLSITGASTSGLYTPADRFSLTCSYVGLKPDGTENGNTFGIAPRGADHVIGGSNAGEGNVISGNDNSGITLRAPLSNLTIEGNFIGTDPTGLSGIGNAGSGIATDDNSTSPTLNTIRKNLISDNTAHGINFTSGNTVSGSSGDLLIAGNYIGVDRTGNTALPNGGDGTSFDTGSISGVTLGGTNAADRNIISGNTSNGVFIQGVSDIDILGNYFGLGGRWNDGYWQWA